VTVEFHPAALDDIFEAAVKYESERLALGERFTEAVAATLETLDAFPRMGGRFRVPSLPTASRGASPSRAFRTSWSTRSWSRSMGTTCSSTA